MKNSLYNSMLSGLNKVNLGGFERARAELHMRRAAAFVEFLMGSRGNDSAAPTVAQKAEEYRTAA
jgi:hypothetical protein